MCFQVQAHTHNHTTGHYIKRQVAERVIGSLFGQLADLEDGGLMSQRTIFPELEVKLLLH